VIETKGAAPEEYASFEYPGPGGGGGSNPRVRGKGGSRGGIGGGRPSRPPRPSRPSKPREAPVPQESMELAAARDLECKGMRGKWGRTVFNDWETNKRLSGYSCEYTLADKQSRWVYFDSKGYQNHECTGKRASQKCVKDSK
jgi:hypothetical protein